MGKILYITSDNKVILKAENLAQIGDRVVDEKKNTSKKPNKCCIIEIL